MITQAQKNSYVEKLIKVSSSVQECNDDCSRILVEISRLQRSAGVVLGSAYNPQQIHSEIYLNNTSK